MKSINSNHHIDVLIIYQDKESVKHVILQLQELSINFKTLIFDHNRFSDILHLAPKLILLSSNNTISTIKFYIELLEKYEDKLCSHSSVLLVNNKNAAKAYLACQQGLFDDYVIINPLIEPYRLKLLIQQRLKIRHPHGDSHVNELLAASGNELANCISYGVKLKSNVEHQLSACQQEIIKATLEQCVTDESNEVLQHMVKMTFSELNQNLSTQIQQILTQMLDVKALHSTINDKLTSSNNNGQRPCSSAGINLTSLLKQQDDTLLTQPPKQYKLLIAEHSELFTKLLIEIFEDTHFDFVVAHNGTDALMLYKVFQPDVILLSYDLPNIDGIEVTKRLRQQGEKVPIVAFSQHQNKRLINQWIPLGLSGYIVKPSTKKNILNTVIQASKSQNEIISHNHNHNHAQIEWIPAYSVGNELIDMQHKKLFSLINDFFNNSNQEAVKALFSKLAQYIKIHFEAEEELMFHCNYPKIIEHQQKHIALTKKFELMANKLETYNEANHHKIGLFLYNWLAKHILKEDLDYKPYAIKQSNIDLLNNNSISIEQ
ncbi:hypothetical protein tinsulaeT_26830 [Thalassotalea insulae]|uniref:Response regulatory domain-containing protein n=1 Tax=Thalassotalea insulae TaxID=2056778 RepID=A0ABQ6GTT6_9GAMM|nr:bacteriohemerythrin [Thalassotalea insulae]GLX79343.1 hypothetical protein tinsulaeT_26830 [Thalassotalea insulae]